MVAGTIGIRLKCGLKYTHHRDIVVHIVIGLCATTSSYQLLQFLDLKWPSQMLCICDRKFEYSLLLE